jgi:hypothetical protein
VYVVIDPDGSVRHEQQTPTLDRIDAIVQHGGWARVRLAEDWAMAGWVSDCGLIDGAARNPVGACVLATLGAVQQPYAGPVVVTGYDYGSEWGGPEPLGGVHVSALTDICDGVHAALAGREVTGPMATNPLWAPQIREYAEIVRTGEAPRMRILSDEEAAAYWRRQGWPL